MRDDDSFAVISKIRRGMEVMLLEALKQAGVSGIAPSHGQILLALFDGQRLPMNELAEQIGKTPQTVTVLVKKLAEMGYLKSERVPADRRSSVVSLTEQGERLKPVFQSVCRQLQETQYRGLSQEEIVQLRRMLTVVAENFSAYIREEDIQNV